MQAPKLPSFFPTPKSKSFRFQPRYYDPRKEQLEQIKHSKADPKNMFQRKTKKQMKTKSMRTSFLILITLLLLAYLLLK